MRGNRDFAVRAKEFATGFAAGYRENKRVTTTACGAPGEAWCEGMEVKPCPPETRFGTQQAQVLRGKVRSDQPVASLAWARGDPACEA